MNALITATVVRFVERFEKNDISSLADRGYKITVASSLSNNTRPEAVDSLLGMGVDIVDVCFSRSPFSLRNIKAYRQLKALINSGDFDVIHCHTPVAGILTRLAARRARKNGVKVVYTAHGFHFYKGAPLKNYLTFYPAEKLCSKMCDALITINTEDYELAKKKFKRPDVYYVPGVGIDASRFSPCDEARRNELKKELFGFPEGAKVLLSVGEHNVNKNHATVMRAVAKLNDPTIYYLLCGVGVLTDNLKNLASELGIADRVVFAGLRRDIEQIYNCADVFCLPSIREGLSVSTMEAMACGLPIINSKIRGNTDLVKEGEGGWMVEPLDVDGFAQAIKEAFSNMPEASEYGEFNVHAVEFFTEQSVKEKMDAIYTSLLGEKKEKAAL